MLPTAGLTGEGRILGTVGDMSPSWLQRHFAVLRTSSRHSLTGGGFVGDDSDQTNRQLALPAPSPRGRGTAGGRRGRAVGLRCSCGHMGRAAAVAGGRSVGLTASPTGPGRT